MSIVTKDFIIMVEYYCFFKIYDLSYVQKFKKVFE